MSNKWHGLFTALVTPFQNGQVDTSATEKLVEMQCAAGVTGLVPVGTTGESPTLGQDEHLRFIELCVQLANKRCLVLAGTGSNCTSEAIEMTQSAERVGADGCLLVAPYYNKPPQEGLYQHFRAIANATELPLILYSIPGRCGIEISIETVSRLARDCDNIVGIKEAGGKVERVTQLRQACPAEFSILSGDDGLTLAFMKEGANGLISVASNIVPAPLVDLVRCGQRGDWSQAESIHTRYADLFRVLFLETNPIPVKAALSMMGLIRDELRLPLVTLSTTPRAEMEAVLKRLDLL